MNAEQLTLWSQLESAGRLAQQQRIADHFAADPTRKGRFSARLSGLSETGGDDLVLDLSRSHLTEASLTLLHQLLLASGFERLREDFRRGAAINTSENRAVLHPALRARAGDRWETGGQSVMAEVLAVKNDFLNHAEALRNDPRITDIVNIGIGGSDLGPAMASLALQAYGGRQRLHYISNIDPAALQISAGGA